MIPIIYVMSEKEVLSFEPRKGFGVIYKYEFPSLVTKYKTPSYIGQTTQILSRRHSQHKSHIKSSNIFNNTLSTHNDYILKIIELCPEPILNNEEIYWIDKYNTVFPNGLNYDTGGKRIKMCEATRQKLSKSLRLRLSSEEYRAKTSKRVTEQWQDPIMREKMVKCMKEKHKPRTEEYMSKIRTPVMQISPEGRFIALHPSIAHASKETGIAREQIRDTVNGKQHTCKGFKFVAMMLG